MHRLRDAERGKADLDSHVKCLLDVRLRVNGRRQIAHCQRNGPRKQALDAAIAAAAAKRDATIAPARAAMVGAQRSKIQAAIAAARV